MSNSTKKTWYKNSIVYGVAISKFFDADADGIGDLRGLITKLDYLDELGIDCIWLLPFYPTTHKDNGYDITNYNDIDPSLGTLEDFRTFMGLAKAKGIKVIIDLVIHHTSYRHPWFIASSNDRQSRYKDYYIWRDSIVASQQTENAFPTVEDGVWQYDEFAHSYYRHQFYKFEPDLNLANPDVNEEIYRIVDFWLAFGVDGFRIDAATHVLNHKGMFSPKNLSVDFFTSLRKHIDKYNDNVVLIGEADLEFPKIMDYLDGRNGMQVLYNFLLDAKLFQALATEDTRDIVAHLEEQEKYDKWDGSWLNFVRNLDELNLFHLSKSVQQEVKDKFAPEPGMSIFERGIRRRLPTMLGNDEQWIKMTYSTLFSFSGIPAFMYGEEIGMGDDLALPGRDSVRIPMQWDKENNAGFSAGDSKNLVAPVNHDKEYGYKVVNVAEQKNRKDSLWNFFRDIIVLRKEYAPYFNVGSCSIVVSKNKSLLIQKYDYKGKSLVTVHNFSSRKQKIDMKIKWSKHLFGNWIEDNTLLAHGYSWYEVDAL